MTDFATHEDDVPPQAVEGSVVFFAYAAIISAAIMSITLNVYHDVHHDPHSNASSFLPAPIAVMVGVFVPLLCAFISHVAASIPTNEWVKGWLFTLTGALMYVSATAGVKTLAPVIGLGPALAACVGFDATAMTFLGVLMLAMTRKTALAGWRARAAERERRAAAATLAARQARPAARETVQGNVLSAAGGNGQGNAPALSGGNTLALPAGNTAPARPPAGPLAADGETGPGEGPEGQGSGLASVSQMRRPAVTDEEIRTLAEDLAGKLESADKKLSVRAYIYGEGCADVPGLPDDFKGYGGKTSRVSPIIAEVKATRENQAPAAAGAR